MVEEVNWGGWGGGETGLGEEVWGGGWRKRAGDAGRRRRHSERVGAGFRVGRGALDEGGGTVSEWVQDPGGVGDTCCSAPEPTRPS